MRKEDNSNQYQYTTIRQQVAKINTRPIVKQNYTNPLNFLVVNNIAKLS